MIRKLLATTALAMVAASGALAQDTTAPAPAAPATQNAAPTTPAVKAEGQLATNIIGESVYNGTGDSAQNIGKVTDVVFDKDGQAKSVVIGVGGFLGVGSKDVTFDFSKLQWAEKNGDRWLVAKTTKEQLTAQPAFDDTPFKPAQPPAAAQPSTTTAPATDNTAQNAPATAPIEPAKPASIDQGQLASAIIGENVYNGTGSDAQDIGNVNDIVLSKEGKMQSLVIGVGGFLGLGQKNVAFDHDKAKPMERGGDRFLVVEATKEQLQALPDFDRKAYDPAPAAAAAGAETAPTMTPTTDTAQNSTAGEQAGKPDTTETAAIDKSTLTALPEDKISADNLIGTTVYGSNDAKVGKIGDIVLSSDNKVDAIVVDVGGFLGIGAKPVAIGMDNLKFMTDKDGKNYLYTNFTKEQLEAQTAYDKGSYAENRDKQRMVLKP
ncbi:PRC-barrel domain-containing protein [Mesorhizobium sp. SP-1A]|uniref:PRC-barrel domain-containing protein n=1 Tax=Mesorhizobium sp. SP-1A TaxID=3077840 RepID=UPI0028F70BB1|nr:PRC-barrel domain-containing protein [Mesorhizobium sp. SP-1A]